MAPIAENAGRRRRSRLMSGSSAMKSSNDSSDESTSVCSVSTNRRRTTLRVQDVRGSYKRSSFCSNRSRTLVSNLSLKRRRIATKKEVKRIIDEIFHDDLNQGILQAKMDFFYGAYNSTKATQPHMVFEEKDESFSDSQRAIRKNSQWKNISKNVFVTNEQRFRNFLKTINQNMYVDLISLGHKYCNKIVSKGIVNDDEEIDDENDHPHFKKGMQMLKDIIKEKILKKKKKPAETPKQIESSPVRKEEILKPLLFIGRGNTMKFGSMQRPRTQGDLVRGTAGNSKLNEKLQFTNLRTLVTPSKESQKPDYILPPSPTRNTCGKSTRRRRTLFNYLHSEKQVPKLKLSKNCISCHKSSKNVAKNRNIFQDNLRPKTQQNKTKGKKTFRVRIHKKPKLNLKNIKEITRTLEAQLA